MSEAAAMPMWRAAKRMHNPHLYRVAVAYKVSPTEVRRHWAFRDIYDTWIDLDARQASDAIQRREQERKAKHG